MKKRIYVKQHDINVNACNFKYYRNKNKKIFLTRINSETKDCLNQEGFVVFYK